MRSFFDEVPRYEFGRLRQKRPETDQPASPVVEFTLTNHVPLGLTCGEAGWGRAYRCLTTIKRGLNKSCDLLISETAVRRVKFERL